jgi:TRAP-type C4-dicarboxylate transport system substrate-binding protein
MRRLNLTVIILAAACLVLPASNALAAEKIQLAIASWNVPKDPNTKVLKAIAEDLEKATGGTVTSNISFKALGKPTEYYDAVANGICDIAYVGLPYTPGRFPFSEMLGLPINLPTNVITTKAHYQLWKKGYLDEQFADVHPIAVGSTSPYNFFWGKEPVTDLAGFKGKKIRAPGGPWSALVEAVGGVPVSVAVGEMYMALERGTIDGILQTWPAVPVFKLHEVSGSMTEMNLCGFTFVVAMNKDSYQKLPPEAKKVLDQNAEKYSLIMGNAHHGFNQVGMKMMAGANRKVNKLSAADRNEMNKRINPIFKKWISDMEKRGLPGKKALDELYVILQDLGVKEPFVK